MSAARSIGARTSAEVSGTNVEERLLPILKVIAVCILCVGSFSLSRETGACSR